MKSQAIEYDWPTEAYNQNILRSPESHKEKRSKPNRKWARDLNGHLTKEVLQMANEHMKRCIASLIVRKTQNKSTICHQYIPMRMAKMKKMENTKC